MARADLELSAEEIRVLGCLIEKERSTPDQYPLTTNALRTACNQKSNRDPVMNVADPAVEEAMFSLRDRGYARSVRGSGRTIKHKQVLDEAMGLDDAQVSVLGMLLLRGPQTPNELRTRTDRLHGFADNDEVEATLQELAGREEPLVVCVGKRPGQREARWTHLLADETVIAEPEPEPDREPAHRAVDPSPVTTISSTADRISELETEVAALRQELDALRGRFDSLAGQLGVEEP